MNLSMIEIIAKKRDGGELSRPEIDFFLTSYVNDAIPDYQAAALLMAAYLRGLSQRELSDLTESMLFSGERISLSDIDGAKVDKHSTGGVGDKLSLSAVPLVAACGIKVPMLAGRALGHTGGTLDKLEAIPGLRVFLTGQEFKRTLRQAGMAISGQTENLAPADRKLYALRDSTATVNSIPLIAASIMSKKLAVASDAIVLDVKTGSGALLTAERDSLSLCRTMVDLGEAAGRKTVAVVTAMEQPLGLAVGNSLEIREALDILRGNGPEDVRSLTIALAAVMLLAAGAERAYDQAANRLGRMLDSGQALATFQRFIEAQGGNPRVGDDPNLLPSSPCRQALTAASSGFITAIDACVVGLAAIELGAGRFKKEDRVDPAAGIVFAKKVGERVSQGEAIAVVHAAQSELAEAGLQRLRPAIQIQEEPASAPALVRYYVDRRGTHAWEEWRAS